MTKNPASGQADLNGHADPLSTRLYSLKQPPSLERFSIICGQQAEQSKYPLATSIEKNVPIYALPLYSSLTSEDQEALQTEWYNILLSGPGVFVIRGLYTDKRLLDSVNHVYDSIISKEKLSNSKGGDHFATGNNDRIWNSFSKHCLTSANSFFSYYSNPYLALICSSWLGPAYRLTAQVNIVRPGGQAQMPHRDYHLGFQTRYACAQFPKALQVASQFLTLQGAIAHTDMPLASGPTRLLPFSQTFDEGYMAYRQPEFKQYFLDNYISLPLEQGDGLFFNPALFHAAGENVTDNFSRSANLLQISSAFGKPMETIDTLPLIEASWDMLSEMYTKHGESAELQAFVAAVAEGYPFPTNLDRMPPRQDGMAPQSQQELLMSALVEKTSKGHVMAELREMTVNSTA